MAPSILCILAKDVSRNRTVRNEWPHKADMKCSTASLKRGESDLQYFIRHRTYPERRPPAVPETTWSVNAAQDPYRK